MKTNPLLTAAIVSALAVSSSSWAANDGKVTICHKDKVEITVSTAALNAHLAHGDSEGVCPPPPPAEEPAATVSDETVTPDDTADDTSADADVVVVEEPAPLCKAPVESEVTVELEDGSAYDVALVSQDGPTWTYKVEQAAGKDLSHWALGLEACFEHVLEADGAEIGTDGSTGFVGIKWDSEGGEFSVTLDGDYPATLVQVLAKAGTLSSTALIAGPDCEAAPEEVTAADDGAEAADSAEATKIALEDDKDSEYSVALSSHEGNTWIYEVAQVEGRDLSHWSLGLGSCAEHITATSDGADVGTDGSTGFVGVKWDSEGGTFSITLDDDYPQSELEALVKAGTASATGLVPGPDCSSGTVEELPVCSSPEDLAALPLEQTLLLESLVAAWDGEDGLSALEPDALLAELQAAGYPRGFLFKDLLFLPNMQIPGMELSFAGFNLKFTFSILLQRVEEGGSVTFNVIAVALESSQASENEVDGDYSLENMELSVPVVDVVSVVEDEVSIASFSLELTPISLEPMSFQAVLSASLVPEEEETTNVLVTVAVEETTAASEDNTDGDNDADEEDGDEENEDEDDDQGEDEQN